MIEEKFFAQRNNKFSVEKVFCEVFTGGPYPDDVESSAMNGHLSDRN